MVEVAWMCRSSTSRRRLSLPVPKQLSVFQTRHGGRFSCRTGVAVCSFSNSEWWQGLLCRWVKGPTVPYDTRKRQDIWARTTMSANVVLPMHSPALWWMDVSCVFSFFPRILVTRAPGQSGLTLNAPQSASPLTDNVCVSPFLPSSTPPPKPPLREMLVKQENQVFREKVAHR